MPSTAAAASIPGCLERDQVTSSLDQGMDVLASKDSLDENLGIEGASLIPKKNFAGLLLLFKKVHEMLTEASHKRFDDIVSWLPDETAFKIHKPEEFAETVMPHYFTQSTYKSFQCALSLCGFYQIEQGPTKGSYTHQLFIEEKKPAMSSTEGQRKTSSKYGMIENVISSLAVRSLLYWTSLFLLIRTHRFV